MVSATRQARASITNISNRSPCFCLTSNLCSLHCNNLLKALPERSTPVFKTYWAPTEASNASSGRAPAASPHPKRSGHLPTQSTGQAPSPSEPLRWPGTPLLQVLTWLACAAHSAISVKSAAALSPVHQATPVSPSADAEASLELPSLPSSTCRGRSSATRVSARTEGSLPCSLGVASTVPGTVIYLLNEWVSGEWMDEYAKKIPKRKKTTSEGKYVWTITYKGVSDNFQIKSQISSFV